MFGKNARCRNTRASRFCAKVACHWVGVHRQNGDAFGSTRVVDAACPPVRTGRGWRPPSPAPRRGGSGPPDEARLSTPADVTRPPSSAPTGVAAITESDHNTHVLGQGRCCSRTDAAGTAPVTSATREALLDAFGFHARVTSLLEEASHPDQPRLVAPAAPPARKGTTRLPTASGVCSGGKWPAPAMT